MPEPQEQQHSPIQREAYEHEEINAKLIGGLIAGTLIFLIVSGFVLDYFYKIDYEQQVYVKVLEPVANDLQNLRARENEQLHSYKYINREQGTVRLPIERAMELLESEYAAGAVRYPTSPYPVKKVVPAEGGANAAK